MYELTGGSVTTKPYDTVQRHRSRRGAGEQDFEAIRHDNSNHSKSKHAL